MRGNKFLQKSAALLLALIMSCSVSVCPIVEAADSAGVPDTNISTIADVDHTDPDYGKTNYTKSDLDALSNALHFYIRHWHTVYPAQASLQEIRRDEASGCYFVIVDGYIVPKDTKVGSKTIEAGAYLIDTKNGDIAWKADKSRYIPEMGKNDDGNWYIVMIANPVSETGTFGGVSISAGQGAAEVTEHLIDGVMTPTLTITYDPYIHLVKGHVFYINVTKDALPDEYKDGNGFDEDDLQIDTKVINGDKYYNTSDGLHTDKSVTEVKDEDGTSDGRTFELELESWFTEGDPPNVGMILDASGSMAFTSGTPERINVIDFFKTKYKYDEEKGEYTYEDGVEIANEEEKEAVASIYKKIGSLSEQMSASYRYPQRDKLIGYYPITKQSADNPDNNSEKRQWRLNTVTGNYKTGTYASRLMEQIDLSGDYKFVEDTEYNPQGIAGMSFVGEFGIEVGAQTNGGEQLRGILLDAKPSGTSFTVSFSLYKDGNDNQPDNIAEILYIGPLEGNADDSTYYRLIRDSSSNYRRLRGYNNSNTKFTDINSVFVNTTRHVITLVFDGEMLTSYDNGTRSGNAQPFSFSEDDDIRIVIDGIVDKYDINKGGRILIDDIFVYDVALEESEVKTLYDTFIKDKPNANSTIEVDVDSTESSFTPNWSDAFLTETELKYVLNPHNTDNSRLGTAGYNYYVLPTGDSSEYTPLGYWGGVLADNGYSALTEDGGTVIGSLRDGTNIANSKALAGRFKGKAGWYMVSHSGSSSLNLFYNEESIQSAKDLFGLNKGNAGATVTDNIPGATSNTGLTYTVEASVPSRFYIDSEGCLRCFYGSTPAVSYVYKSSDEAYIKTEALQRAMGGFVTRLLEKSKGSQVSAVRFSAEAFDDKQMVILDWTSDPATAEMAMSLKYGDGGTTKGQESSNGNVQYNYGLTGGTITYKGFEAFKSQLGSTLDNGNGDKYIILFTDGMTDSGAEEKTQTRAAELREEGYIIFTVLLTGGTVEYGASQYDKAKELLISLSGDSEIDNIQDPDEQYKARAQYFFATDAEELKSRIDGDIEHMDKVDLLVAVFTQDILEQITSDLTEYTIQDYIDPRFDLIDADGNLLQLNYGGKVCDENGELLYDVSTGGVLINLSNKDNVNGTHAYLNYDSTGKDMYYLVWENQSIPTCVKDASDLVVWSAKVTVRAKADLIGGNAILTNGNDSGENYVYTEGSQSTSSGTGNSIRPKNWDTDGNGHDGSVSKGFPRTTVNVKLIADAVKSESQIFMGQNLSEEDVIKLLIRGADGTTEYLYWEYLYRYADYYKKGVNLPAPKILVFEEENEAQGNSLISALTPVSVSDTGERATLAVGEILSDEVDINLLLKVALGKLFDGDAINSAFGNFKNTAGEAVSDAYIIEHIKKGAKIQLQLPYAYLPEVVESIDENGVAEFLGEAPNTTGGEEHKADVLGYLTYHVTTEVGPAYGEYGTTKDTLPRVSSLGANYSPLPIESAAGGEDRVTKNNELVKDTENGAPVYQWNSEIVSKNDGALSTDKSFEGQRTTKIVSGDVVLQMNIDSSLIDRLNDGETVVYTTELKRTYKDSNGTVVTDVVGRFELVYTKKNGDTTATITGLLTEYADGYEYIEYYGLPIGTYSFGEGTVSGSSDIKLKIDDFDILDASSLDADLFDGTKYDTADFDDHIAAVSGNSIILGYDEDGLPNSRFGGASLTVYASDSGKGDLVVGKKVVNKNGDPLTDYQKELAFHYEVELTSDAANKPEDFNGESWTWDSDNSVWTWDGGTITFDLKHGESYTIADIPADVKYTVTEVEIPDGYTAEEESFTAIITPDTVSRENYVNTYTLKPVTLDIDVNKTLVGADDLESYSFDFDFEIATDDESPLPDDEKLTLRLEKSDTSTDNATENSGSFEIEYNKPGTYHYTVTETNSGEDGIVYDDTTYEIEVTVTDNNDGTLSAEITKITVTKGTDTSESDEISFTNYYRDAGFTLKGTKTVTGPLNDRKKSDGSADNSETFSFTVTLEAPDGFDYEAAGYDKDSSGKYSKTVSITVTADSDDDSGSYKSDEKVFIEDTYYLEGTYTYTIRENEVTTKGFADDYDDTVYTVIVEVEEDEDTHTLTASQVYDDGDDPITSLDFINPYKVSPVTVSGIGGTKNISGRDWTDDDDGKFEFTITPDDPAYPLPEVTKVSAARKEATDTFGTFVFGGITFSAAGTYTYKVFEDKTGDGQDGLDYDPTVYTVIVTVTDIGGELTAEVSYAVGDDSADKIEFTNEYSTKDTVSWTPSVKKILSGKTSWDSTDKFTFNLSLKDGNSDKVNAKATQSIEITDADTDHTKAFDNITFSAAGTYVFEIGEDGSDPIDNIKYSDVKHTVTVVIEDDGKGGLVVASVNGETVLANVAPFEFTNIYTGSLTVSNVITGYNVDEDMSFSFEVTLKLPAGTDITMVELPDGVVLDGTTLKFSLKDGESIVFKNIPVGTEYTVTETDANTAGFSTTITDTGNSDPDISNGTTTATIGDTVNHNAVVEFINTRPAPKTGDLTVLKTVVSGDKTKKFNFTVTLTLPADTNMSTITAEASPDGTDAEININDAAVTVTFKLADGQSVTISGIPEGTTYTVVEEEANQDKYATKYDYSDEAKSIADGDTDTVEVTNTYDTGSLTVSKNVINGDNSKAFRFTVTFASLPAGITADDFTADGGNDVVKSGNTITFTLTDGDSITIGKIPVGVTYEVAESDYDGYTPDISYGNETKMIAKGITDTVEVTNTYDTGSLTVSKKVDGDQGETDRGFNFTVTLTLPDNADVSAVVVPETATCNGNVITFTLKHGQSVTISNIPVGTTYTVVETEANTDGYATTVEYSNKNETKSITKDTEDTVEFTNTRPAPDTGSLTVSKKVDGEEGETDRGFNFTVTLTLPDDVDIYELAAEGTGTDISIVGTTVTFKLADGQNVTITGIPVGTTYTVIETEANTDGYATTSEYSNKNETKSITKDTEDTVEFTNTRPAPDTGSLTVSKSVVNGDNSKAFSFTVTLNIPADADTSKLSASGTGTDIAVVGTVVTFKLAHGQNVTITGIPVGTTYTVEESDYDGYTPESAYSDENKLIEKDDADTVTVTNTFIPVPDPVGNLSVSKDITGNADHTGKVFNFRVTLSRAIDGTFADPNSPDKAMTFEGGVATFTLGDNETATAYGLPAGITYTVEEIDANSDGYETTVSRGTATGTIPVDGTAVVLFENHKDKIDVKTGSLTVSKTVTGLGDKGRPFNFTVTLNIPADVDTYKLEVSGTGTDINVGTTTVTFKLTDGQNVTITGIPAGTTYTVVETEANTEGYTTTATGDGGTITAGANASFTNHIPEPSTASLTVSKTVEGNAANPEDVFHFDVYLYRLDADGITELPATDIPGFENDGAMMISLRGGQSQPVTIPLAFGDVIYYRVTEVEANQNGYVTTTNGGESGFFADGVNVTAAASFTNTKNTVVEPTGSLTVSKTVSGAMGDTTEDFAFTVTLIGAEISGPYGEMKFESGVAHITVRHGQTVTASGLPAGVGYIVVEDEANMNGYVTEATNSEGIIPNGGTASAAFANHRDEVDAATGTLVVSKAVIGSAASSDDEFTFRVTFTNADGSYSYTYNDGVRTGTVSDGDTFKLRGGEWIVISGIPVGAGYKVEEIDSKGYTPNAAVFEGAISETTSTVSFINQKDAVVTPPPVEDPPVFTPDTGALDIAKTVSQGETDREFEFVIEFRDAWGNLIYDYFIYGGSKSGSVRTGTVFTLKHGEHITVYGLPAGITYSVSEYIPDDYSVITSGTEGRITSGQTAYASFINYQEVSRPTQETDNDTDSETDTAKNPKTGLDPISFSISAVLSIIAAAALKLRRKRL